MILLPFGGGTSGGQKERRDMPDWIITCECGLKWRLHRVKAIARGSGSVNCTCGRELVNWNGGHMWIRDPKPIETQSSPPPLFGEKLPESHG